VSTGANVNSLNTDPFVLMQLPATAGGKFFNYENKAGGVLGFFE